MGNRLFTNNAKSTLASGISNVDTTITVATGHGAKFSSPSVGFWQDVTLDDGTNIEIVRMTARSGDTLTVTRGQEGTTAVAFATGAKVEARFTAGAAGDIYVGQETTTSAGALINSATSKATPVDADQIGLMDSEASNVLKKLSWANLKATLKAYFDTLYAKRASTCLAVACSDESTALTAGTNKVKFINPFSTAFNVTSVVASLSTAQTSGSIFTVDINEAGTSILSTKLTIDNTETNSTTAATAAVISDASIAAGAEVEIDIDQVGDGTAKGLKVYLIGYPS